MGCMRACPILSQVLRHAMQHAGSNDELVQALVTKALPALVAAQLQRLPLDETDRKELMQLSRAAIEKANSQTVLGDLVCACLDSNGEHDGVLVAFFLVFVRTLKLSDSNSASIQLIQTLLRVTLEHVLRAVLEVPAGDAQSLVCALHLSKFSIAQLHAIAASRGSLASQLLTFARTLLANCALNELRSAWEQQGVKMALHKSFHRHIAMIVPFGGSKGEDHQVPESGEASANGETSEVVEEAVSSNSKASTRVDPPRMIELLVTRCVELLFRELLSLCGDAGADAKPTEPMVTAFITAKPQAMPAIMFDLVLHAAKQMVREADFQDAEEMKHLLIQMIKPTLVKHGTTEEDADAAIEMLKSVLDNDLLAALTDPPKLACGFFAAGGGEVALRCAQAMTVHWISERLLQRGFDARVVWIVREALVLMPADEVAWELARSPEDLLNKVLKQATDQGQELAQELLEDGLTRAREAAMSKLEALGMPPGQAQFLAEQAQDYLIEGADIFKDLALGDSEGAAASTEDVLLKLKEEVASISAASALAFMGFFLRHRFLPLFDMISDIFVAAELCTNDQRLGAGVGGFLRGECTFDRDDGEERRVFFILTVVFFFANWAVLWLALGMHLLKVPAYAQHFLAQHFLIDYGFRPLTMIAYDKVFGWLGFGESSLRKVGFGLCMLPVVVCVELPAIVLGLLCVLAIELLNKCGYNLLKSRGLRLGYTAWFALWTLSTLPVGVPLLILVEIFMLIFCPSQPAPGAFSSAYENLRRVLEPALESAPQAIIQLSYLALITARGKPFDDYTIVASLLASLGQLYQTFYYLRGTAQAYRQSMLSTVIELASLSAVDKVPFRLVLRSWASVDYRSVRNDLGIEMFRQVGEALAGNVKLRRLCFAKRQISGEELKVLSSALVQSRVSEFAIVDDWTLHAKRHEALSSRSESGKGIHTWSDAARSAQIQMERLFGDEDKLELPDAFITGLLGVTSSLRILRLEGFELEPRQWNAMLSALGTGRCMEQLHLAGPRIGAPANEVEIADLPSTHALATLRSLKHLTVHRVPPSVLDALFRGGLHKSRSIVRLDLSHNKLRPGAARAVEAWLRRPQLKTVLLHGVSFTTESGATFGARVAAMCPLLLLLSALRDPRASVQVFLITINTGNAQAGDGSADAQQAQNRLSRAEKFVLNGARSARFVAVGRYDGERPAVQGHSRMVQMWDHTRGAVRAIANALVPCLSLHETNVSTMLASLQRRQHNQSDAMADVCAAVVTLASSVVMCSALLLQQLPAALTTDIGLVLARHVLMPSESHKHGQSTSKPQGWGQKQCRVTPAVEKDGEQEKQRQVQLAVNSCRQADGDVRACLSLYADSTLTHLALRDNPITEMGLHALTQELHVRQARTKLQRVEFKASTQLPANMILGLAHLAKQLEGGCGGPLDFPGFNPRSNCREAPRRRSLGGFGGFPSVGVLDDAVASAQRSGVLKMGGDSPGGLLGQSSQQVMDALGVILSLVVAANLSGQGIPSEQAKRLAQGLQGNVVLTSLDLSLNNLDAAAGKALADALKLNSVLTNLSVARNNNLSGEAAQQLAAAALGSKSLQVLSEVPIKELREDKHTELNLTHKGLGPTEGIVLAELVKGSAVLTSLDLSNNLLDAEAGKALAASLAVNAVLTECSLLDNNFDVESATMLAKIGTEKCIMPSGMKLDQTEANFVDQCLMPADAILIASDLAFMAVLTSLNLSQNSLCGIDYIFGIGTYDASGIKALASALAGSAVLTHLNLTRNNLGADGAKAIAGALSSGMAVLTSLDISRNYIGPELGVIMAEVLEKNAVLTTIECVFCARTLQSCLQMCTHTFSTLARSRQYPGCCHM